MNLLKLFQEKAIPIVTICSEGFVISSTTNISSMPLAYDYLDYVPIVGTLKNLVDIFLKYVVLSSMKKGDIEKNHYYKHIDKKSFIQCGILLVPVLGSIFIVFFKYENVKTIRSNGSNRPRVPSDDPGASNASGVSTGSNDKNSPTDEITPVKDGNASHNSHVPLTVTEGQALAYMMDTLANAYLISLSMKADDLEQAGKKLNGVKALTFLLNMLSDPVNRDCFRKIKKRSMVWGRFISRIKDSWGRALARGDMNQKSIDDFASALKINSHDITPLIQAGRWDDFINMLLAKLP